MPISPGRYMHLCREAAGLSIDDVALSMGTSVTERAWVRAELGALEAGDPGEYESLVRYLHMTKAFGFDPDVYRALVEAASTSSSETS